MRKATVLILCLILFAAGGFILEKSRFFAPLKQNLNSKSVPTAVLNYGPMGKALKQLEVVRAIKNDYSMFTSSEESGADMSTITFQKKRQVGEFLYTANPGGARDMPSSLIIDEEELKDGWPLISITVNNDDLYSKERGIITNYRSRGQEWERLAHVSYFEEGKLLFATSAGIRLHGNRPTPASCRLYFRDAYGTQQFKPGILFSPETEPIRTLVVRISGFRSSLASDICQRIGAVVPEYKLAKFYFNGKYLGIFSLTEHLSRRQWRSHFGHDNFLFYNYNSLNDEESVEGHKKLRLWALDTKTEMTLKEANKFINVDNLARHLFASMFLGNTDWRQGAAALDRSKAGGKWFWILWDLDHSFEDYVARWMGERQDWKQEGVELILGDRMGISASPTVSRPPPDRDIRAVIFTRLLIESREYRNYFKRLAMDLLNHRINAEFMQSRADYYEEKYRTLKEYPELLSRLEMKKRFMRLRANSIRDQIQRYLGEDRALPCEVKGPAGIRYEIDGYPEIKGYYGLYFKGRHINVEIVSKHKESFSHWLVNGKKVEEHPLSHLVISKTVIEPIFKSKSNDKS